MPISASFEKLSDLQAGNAAGSNVSNSQPRLALSAHDSEESGDIFMVGRKPDHLPAINGRVIVKIEAQIEVNLTSLIFGKIGLIKDIYSLETKMVSQQR
jgi:hypothetical protein